eukprot:TRINITY_DN5808_c0_g1_i1.p2 TRINITY_DN5808_c0_g1~~TRINITY_DN5808_c0_g1_i1.p2  ORF type:complete len:189 (+),score=70.25 TRINITY_DN5808_c0_g1_i1:497-1063(+)
MAQTVKADLNSIKSTKLFLLHKRIQELVDKLQREEARGSRLKDKFNLTDEICSNLKTVLHSTRTHSTPEFPLRETLNQSEDDEAGSSTESEMPLSLEELSAEVKEFIKYMVPLGNLSKSYNDLNGNGEEEEMEEYYSEYSDIEEETERCGEECEAKRQAARKNAEKCQLCERPFSWHRWRHHCKQCDM